MVLISNFRVTVIEIELSANVAKPNGFDRRNRLLVGIVWCRTRFVWNDLRNVFQDTRWLKRNQCLIKPHFLHTMAKPLVTRTPKLQNQHDFKTSACLIDHESWPMQENLAFESKPQRDRVESFHPVAVEKPQSIPIVGTFFLLNCH